MEIVLEIWVLVATFVTGVVCGAVGLIIVASAWADHISRKRK